MLRHPKIDRICSLVLVLTLLVTGGYMAACASGIIAGSGVIGYETRLFDQSRVHTIDIVMDDWDSFIAAAVGEEYSPCAVVIDGERYANVAIRGKGNTSLSSVASYGNDRYSFKLEFDHYQAGASYHGLDKLSLNNLIQDPTCMKDYIAYTLMGRMGVAAPLCSFVQISVNGEPWGFYLAVEGVEDSFLTRNYGADHGELYKPDSLSFGGGRGNGRNFNMDNFAAQMTGEGDAGVMPQMPGGMSMSGMGGAMPDVPGGMSFPGRNDEPAGKRGSFGMGSGDVMLQYIDDAPASYQNIFGNAKTAVNDEDKARLITSLKLLSDTKTASSAVDQDAVLRYFAVHHFLCNDDSYTGSMIHNYYLYEEDGVLAMIPWDYNLAFGGFGGTDSATALVNRPIDEIVASGDAASRPMAAWITADESAVSRYYELYALMMEELFASGWFAEEFDRVAAMIAPYVLADENGFHTNDEHLTAVAALREFCLLRAESVTGQLQGTIPSTSAGQAENPSVLIDASHVSLSDMGGMDRGMQQGGRQNDRGGDRGFAQGGIGQPGRTAGAQGMQQPDDAGGMQMPGMSGTQPPDGVPGMQLSGMGVADGAGETERAQIQPSAGGSAEGSVPALLAASVSALAAGMLIVLLRRSGR